MIDRLEHDLATLFDDRATAIDAPPVPLDRLVRDGEASVAAHRRRTRAVAVAAVAAAVALAATIPLVISGRDETTPQPAEVPKVTNTSDESPPSVDDLPEGPAPALPYTEDEALHVGEEEYDLPSESAFVLTAGPTLLVLTPSDDQENSTNLWVPDNGELVAPDVPAGLTGVPVLSWDGSLVATKTPKGRRGSRVGVFDADTWEEVAHVVIDTPADQLGLVGIDGQGRVYWSQTGGPYVWAPGERPQRISLPRWNPPRSGPWSLTQVGRDGALLVSPDELRYGTFTAQGGFEASREFPGSGGSQVRLSDDDVLVALPADDADLVTVTALPDGEPTVMLVPRDVERVGLVDFEGGRNVILRATTTGHSTRYLRCDVRSGSCDQARAEGGQNFR